MTDTQSPSELIDGRIAELADWRGEMLARLRALIRETDPEVVEEWKWRGVPVWEHDGILCTGETYKAVVKLTFAKGAALEDPAGLFNSSLEGNTRRAIDFREGETIQEDAFKALIRAAVASYRLFPATGDLMPAGDMTQSVVRLTAEAFTLGIELAAPQLVPEGAIGRRVPVGGVHEHRVMLAPDFGERIARRLQEIVVGIQNRAVGAELRHPKIAGVPFENEFRILKNNPVGNGNRRINSKGGEGGGEPNSGEHHFNPHRRLQADGTLLAKD